MAEKVLMLALSPTMETGTIAGWIKNEGESVSSGDVLCEVETDKATMEYESIQEGTLLKIITPAGAAAKVEEPIAVIGEKGEDISGVLSEIEKERETAVSAEPTGAAPEAAAAQSPPTPQAAADSPQPDSPLDFEDDGRIKASPLARNLASRSGINLGAVRGSGPGGRIVKRDVETAQRTAAPQNTSATPAAARSAAVPTGVAGIGAVLKDENIPVSPKRKIIAERLAQSKFSAPHFYLKMSVNTETLMDARKTLNGSSSVKVSVNAFILKFTAEAIKRHPVINSSWQTDTIRRFGQIDIGLAVAQKDGLITPIVRDCGSKGIMAIDGELSGLIERARDNKLDPEEYTGATFTITSLGTYGVEEFTGIINPPGSAILAVGQMQKVPVVADSGEIVARQQMKLTLSCDHRVIDGAQGANFLKSLKDIIENPVQALY